MTSFLRRKVFFFTLIIFSIFSGLFICLFLFSKNVNAKSISTSVTIKSSGGSGGGGNSDYYNYGKVVLEGWAYPEASVNILKDGQFVLMVKSDKQANFKGEIENIRAGVWTFGLRAEDKKNRKSSNNNLTLTVTGRMVTTVSNILLSPTIELTNKKVKKGEKVEILGQTISDGKINLYIFYPNSAEPVIKETIADSSGFYTYNLETLSLELGSYNLKVKANKEGLISEYSETINFEVFESLNENEEKSNLIKEFIKKCGLRANLDCNFDINKRGVIDFKDISILLYNWGKPKVYYADLNGDGVVDYRDISILLYYWTG